MTRLQTHVATLPARILVVDDEPLVRWALRERLTYDGHRVSEASTVGEALARLDPTLDLVLLDLRLPDGDGLTVLSRLREVAPRALAILMTAAAGALDVAGAARLGAWDLLQKPFNLDDLSAAVAQAVETGRMRRQIQSPGPRP